MLAGAHAHRGLFDRAGGWPVQSPAVAAAQPKKDGTLPAGVKSFCQNKLMLPTLLVNLSKDDPLLSTVTLFKEYTTKLYKALSTEARARDISFERSRVLFKGTRSTRTGGVIQFYLTEVNQKTNEERLALLRSLIDGTKSDSPQQPGFIVQLLHSALEWELRCYFRHGEPFAAIATSAEMHHVGTGKAKEFTAVSMQQAKS